jgi:hypothetical protein
MGRLSFILSLVLVVGGLFLASGVWTYYPGHEYWTSHRAGVPTGLIHGAIAPIMLIVSIFTSYGIYEANNFGWFYDLFFIIGFLFVWAGGSGSTRNVIKNYYNDKNQGDQRLHKDDLNEINKMIEKHVSKKVEESKNKEKPKVSFFKKLFSKKNQISEKEVKKPIKISKKK